MDIIICKLKPEHAEAYAHFFDITPHDVNIDERKCYCITWRSGGWSEEGNDHWFPTREERRERAIGYVKDGYIQGYLAYHDDNIVGWCNVNADCKGCVDYLREFWPIEEYRADIKVKSIFCFVIAPEMQRKGIATQMLEQICTDAKNDGFDFVEAYTNIYNKTEDIGHDFRGPLAMYVKCGFYKCGERDGKIVMRKALI
jgi:GNAT superfamily N-acetyltransferase